MPRMTRNDLKLDGESGIAPSMVVCGLYVVTDPEKLVEITIKMMDVSCESGGLMAVIKLLMSNQ